MLAQVSIAAATAVVNYDLLQNNLFNQDSSPRRIVAAGLAGSAAAEDSEVRLLVGDREVGQLFNTNTGFPTQNADMMPLNEPIPPGSQIRAIVVDAPATNPINLTLDIRPRGGR